MAPPTTRRTYSAVVSLRAGNRISTAMMALGSGSSPSRLPYSNAAPTRRSGRFSLVPLRLGSMAGGGRQHSLLAITTNSEETSGETSSRSSGAAGPDGDDREPLSPLVVPEAETVVGDAADPVPACEDGGPSPSVHPQFRSKMVCELTCAACEAVVCSRGMKAILLADTRVELYSTDAPPVGVQLANDDYFTRNCRCRIRDAACLQCGNVIGYHVTMPCSTCLEACNNGHFWMFHAEGIRSSNRMDPTGTKPLLWASLPCADDDAGCVYENDAVLCR